MGCFACRPTLVFPPVLTDNGGMVIRGLVQNGVVVLEDHVSLPEGTEVTVVVRADSQQPGDGAAGEPSPAPRDIQNTHDRLPDDVHRQMLAEIERIAALPIEGDRTPFSGADHDRVLYGSP